MTVDTSIVGHVTSEEFVLQITEGMHAEEPPNRSAPKATFCAKYSVLKERHGGSLAEVMQRH